MKLFQIILLTFCLLFFTKAQAAHQLYADIDGISIPYGTKLDLEMAQDITTQNIVQGDMFQAYLKNDI